MIDVPKGLGSNHGGGMDDRKCTVPSRHGNTLNSRRATSRLVRLVDVEEMRKDPVYHQGVLLQNWCGTETKRSVPCMVFKVLNKDRRASSPSSH
ncbi:hypothetical protein TNCV_1595211 [Trichonephila clavipes]|nr:hypothetical protein TNCV_1595211 [Trichonephila clavipes]